MRNPFSKRVCVDSGDYILKKKRLIKIQNLKNSNFANYKTSTYNVTSKFFKYSIKLKEYPKEPDFVPNAALSYNSIEIHHLNLFKDSEYEKLSHEALSYRFKDSDYEKLSHEALSYNFKDSDYEKLSREALSYKFKDSDYEKLSREVLLYKFKDSDYEKLSREAMSYKFKDSDYEKLSREAVLYKNRNINPKCKKCSNDLVVMKQPPKEWICDGWDPPNTHCVSGNNTKLGKTDKAYCCSYVNKCNWILCEKCYISIRKKNETLYNKSHEENKEENHEYVPKNVEIQKKIEEERQQMLRDKIENMRKYPPSLNCIKSYEEFLDLAKGFYLTEPFCENTYQDDCLNINNGKLVTNISEGKYSVLDMGKKCLYDENNNLKVNKLMKERGLLNLKGTVLPKLKTERIFKFPLTIKKTHFCSNGVDKMSHEPVNITSNKKNTFNQFRPHNTFIQFRPHKKNTFIQFNPRNTQLHEEGKGLFFNFSSRCGGCNSKKNTQNKIFNVL